MAARLIDYATAVGPVAAAYVALAASGFVAQRLLEPAAALLRRRRAQRAAQRES